MKDTEKLLILADSCSDVLLGGECGWERMDFKEFATECRKAIAYGVRCKNAGLIPPQINTPRTKSVSENETKQKLTGAG